MAANLAETAATHSVTWAVDPVSWTAVVFAMHSEPVVDDGSVLYEVLHLSSPGIDRLA